MWDYVGDIDNVSFQVSAGASKELSSFFLFGKNLRLIGASVKDCVLLYKRTEAEVRMVQIVEDIGFTRRLELMILKRFPTNGEMVIWLQQED